MTIKSKLRAAWWALYVYVRNKHVDYKNNRLAKKRRLWIAHRIDGGGVVPLGKVSQDEAITKVSQWGSVAFVDVEVAAIMYRDKS